MQRAGSVILLALFMFTSTAASAQPDLRQLIESAMDHMRGVSSRSAVTMIIHRPDWQRSMSLDSWTPGDKHSLIRVTAPPKDAGNGTLPTTLITLSNLRNPRR
jgi:hypothetical protein